MAGVTADDINAIKRLFPKGEPMPYEAANAIDRAQAWQAHVNAEETRKREDADRRAAARLIGSAAQKDDANPPSPYSGNVTAWSTQVESSVSGKFWTVEERPDTVNGGTYLFCSCPSWPFMRGKGRDCKHVAYVRPLR